MTKQEIKTQIDTLSAQWILTGTNSGTYGASEAVAAVGCGDPIFAECKIYTQVGTGHTRVIGASVDEAPGRVNRFSTELAAAKAQLRGLQRQYDAMQ